MNTLATQDAPQRNSRKSRSFLFLTDGWWPVLIAAFLLCAVLVSWLSLVQIRSHIEARIEVRLTSGLQTTHETIKLWLHDHIDDAQHLANHPDSQLYIKKLLSLPQDKKTLAASPLQLKLHTVFNDFSKYYDDLLSLQIIAPNRTIIAATDETLLAQMARPGTFDNKLSKVFAGDSQVVFPHRNQEIITDHNKHTPLKQSAIFVAVPCVDKAGIVFAALVLHLDPSQSFSRIVQLARYGESGDSYAFNEGGLLISESRFLDQLQNIGRLESDQSSILTIAPRDPGGDMTAGFQPRGKQYSWPFTLMATQAYIEGKGVNVTGYRDYRGVTVVGAWIWDTQHGFGLAFEINVDEAFFIYTSIRRILIGVHLTMLFLTLGLFYILMKRQKEIKASNQHLKHEVAERQKSEEKFKLLTESSPDGIVIINSLGDIILVNRQTEKLFGYLREELQGRKIELLLPARFSKKHPSHRDLFFKDMCVRPMGEELDLWARYKDGSEFPVEISLSPLKTKGEIVVIASIRDITIRKKNENALLASEEKFRMAMEATEDGLWDWDISSNHVYYSPSWCRMIGYEPHKVKEDFKFWESSICDNDRVAVLAALDAHLKGETPFFEAEHRLLTKDKQKKWVRGRGKIVTFSPGGTPLRMVGTMTDISARKQIEGELRHYRENLEEQVSQRTSKLKENEEKLQRITSSAQMAIIMIDNKGNITFWNSAAVRIFGWEIQEVLGQDLHQLIMPEQYKEAQGNAFSIFRKTGQGGCIGQTVEMTGLRKNGEVFPVELALSGVKVRGKWNAIGLATDISERKATEKQLHLHVDEMERFSRLAVGREQRMINLKKEINDLCDQLGRKKKYRIVQ